MKQLKDVSVLIIEDSLHFQNIITTCLHNIGIENFNTASDYETAIDLFLSTNPDIALIDIDLNSDKSGIDVANTFNSYRKIPFIFITSNYFDDTYEIAKNTGPSAFISKEISDLQLKQSIELCLRSQDISYNSDPEIDDTKLDKDIFLKIGNNLKKVPLDEIDWFGVTDRYASLQIDNKNYPLNISLKEVEKVLHNRQFIRIHQSYLISVDKIESINIIKNIVVIANHELPIGRSYRKNFLKRIKFF